MSTGYNFGTAAFRDMTAQRHVPPARKFAELFMGLTVTAKPQSTDCPESGDCPAFSGHFLLELSVFVVPLPTNRK